MQVRELLVEESARQYIKRMIADGFPKLLGKGYYAGVFQSPAYGNMAVKVFNPKVDRAYKRYLTWALAHQDNAYVPKIADVRYLTDEKKREIGLVFMEKLKHVTERQLKKFCYYVSLESFAPDTISKEQIAGLKRERDDRHQTLDFEGWDPEDWATVAANTKDKDLAEITRFLSKQSQTDLHGANVMVNDRGQCVITDPIA
jgi:hypothetical protein